MLNKKLLLIICLGLCGCVQSECPEPKCEVCTPCKVCPQPTSVINEDYFIESFLKGNKIPVENREIIGTFMSDICILSFYPSGNVMDVSYSIAASNTLYFEEAKFDYDKENEKLIIEYGKDAIYEYDIAFSEDTNTMWLTLVSHNGPQTREYQRIFNQPREALQN